MFGVGELFDYLSVWVFVDVIGFVSAFALIRWTFLNDCFVVVKFSLCVYIEENFIVFFFMYIDDDIIVYYVVIFECVFLSYYKKFCWDSRVVR